MYIRINRGKFDPARLDDVTAILRASEEKLVPAIRQLPGLQSYHTGIDVASGTMITVSIWDTAEHAAAMSGLPEMNAQRPLLQEQGFVFDPITIYEILWQL
jgi:quinol monooxygenase YgiN